MRAADTGPARLVGKRLVLEPLTVEHAAEMVDVPSSPSLYALIGGQPPSLPELTERYRRQAAGPASEDESWLNWIIRFEGRAVGFVQATLLDGAGHPRVAARLGLCRTADQDDDEHLWTDQRQPVPAARPVRPPLGPTFNT